MSSVAYFVNTKVSAAPLFVVTSNLTFGAPSVCSNPATLASAFCLREREDAFALDGFVADVLFGVLAGAAFHAVVGAAEDAGVAAMTRVARLSMRETRICGGGRRTTIVPSGSRRTSSVSAARGRRRR